MVTLMGARALIFTDSCPGGCENSAVGSIVRLIAKIF
jgi:hypothetical protein